jgi:small subunit ribosomal protein S1
MTDREPDLTPDTNQTALQEEYLKSLEDITEGDLIEGTVIEITADQVFVDVGYKSEGRIPLADFQAPPALGDKVSVVLLKKEGKAGDVVVSKNRADLKIFWKNLRKAFQDKEPVDGTFVKSIKGGFEVDLGFGVIAFNPISKADVVRVENPDEYVGIKSKFIIDRLYNENKVKIVVSRRDWLSKEVERKRDEFFATVNVDDEVMGTVKSFTSFGAFIDLGGFDGLLHINDMSWGHVTRPKDFVKKGQEIKLKVIKLDPVEKKINLSLKHFSPDPWSVFEQRYQVGDVVKGRVTKLTDFGAFIEIEEGIEGLAHISEFSWVKRIKHPKEVLNIGDEVEVMILGYDLSQGKVSLGLKQVCQNPWDSIDQTYPVGTRLTRPVVKVTNAGAFVQLEEGIDGFLHVDDMSWTKKIKNPSSVLNPGDEVEVIVVDCDVENHRIQLGMKQLSDDPWESLYNTYPRGSIIEGEISNITDFGMFVRVPGDIEGLINKHNVAESLNPSGDEDPFAAYKVGDKIKAVVTEINPRAQRLSLSIREYQKGIQREELSKYIHDEEEESTVTLGDLLKNKGNDSIK